MKTVLRWLALIVAIAVGARIASFWRDVNNAMLSLRAFRGHKPYGSPKP